MSVGVRRDLFVATLGKVAVNIVSTLIVVLGGVVVQKIVEIPSSSSSIFLASYSVVVV